MIKISLYFVATRWVVFKRENASVVEMDLQLINTLNQVTFLFVATGLQTLVLKLDAYPDEQGITTINMARPAYS